MGLLSWFKKGPSASERELLGRCRGDREMLERLIRFEVSRRPNLTRAAAAASAVDRWKHEH